MLLLRETIQVTGEDYETIMKCKLTFAALIAYTVPG